MLDKIDEKLYKLFKIQCIDLLCLLEMERAGILFHTEEAMKHARIIETKQFGLLSNFHQILGSAAVLQLYTVLDPSLLLICNVQ